MIKDYNYSNIIYGNKNKNDYLYIWNINNEFMIIDLFEKKIFKYIKLHLSISSIINWNNDNIIMIIDNKCIGVYDTKNEKIISRYFLKDNECINNYKIIYSNEFKFYCLIISTNQMLSPFICYIIKIKNI